MALRVYNTLSGKKEEFQPLVPNKVGMYVCGVTVYDYCHIGHARANIVFDIVYRYLQYSSYDVNYVRNYTDVDDKIIARANERGITSQALSEEFIEAFERMANLATRAGTEATERGERWMRVHTPLLMLSKADIVRRGRALGVDLSRTISCYDPTPAGEACGHCDACQLRERGFRDAD